MKNFIENPPLINRYIIIGAGPVGCYLAYQLLEKSNFHVTLYESKSFNRPQIIRIPFSIAKNLHKKLKFQLWPDEETHERIFNISIKDIQDWPRPSCSHWPWINIGIFQKLMINFLKKELKYKNRFLYLEKEVNILEKDFLDENPFYLNIKGIFCTAGSKSSYLRNKLNLISGKSPEKKGHGIYIIYQNNKIENYKRNDCWISHTKLREQGISYATSNNENYDVQLYTYSAGELTNIFDCIPEEFIQHTYYDPKRVPLDMTGSTLSKESAIWFEQYKKIITKILSQWGIKLPSNLKKIKIFYALRTEYYWNEVVTDCSLKEIQCPLFFVGDSAGSTDYKLGLSAGRGFFSAKMIAISLMRNKNDMQKVKKNYQKYWDSVVMFEFNHGSGLSAEPKIQYNYWIKGRYPYIKDNQYKYYLGEYQSFSQDFHKTSEASTILFINVHALKSNIKNLINFSNQFENSKIIPVVSNDGYGISNKLISEISLESGIDFLAVSKLKEAIDLRISGIIPVHRARLIVLDPPLLHDLSSYGKYEIELVLSLKSISKTLSFIEKWLKNNYSKAQLSLKVHILLDVSVDYNKEEIVSLIFNTIQKIYKLDINKINFSGLIINLSCYKPYNPLPKNIFSLRLLQIKAIKKIISELISLQIRIPSIILGDELGLFKEKWSKYFKNEKIKTYTFVVDAIYGIEYKNYLKKSNIFIREIYQLNFQVRDIFYIKNYTHNKEGAWVAHISGGFLDGIPQEYNFFRKVKKSMFVSINGNQYNIDKVSENFSLINLGLKNKIKLGDRAVIFGWGDHEPKLKYLAHLSKQSISSIVVKIPSSVPRILISQEEKNIFYKKKENKGE